MLELCLAGGEEPKTCQGRVFNTKLGRIGSRHGKCMAYILSLLELKTRSWFRPVSFSLCMALALERGMSGWFQQAHQLTTR